MFERDNQVFANEQKHLKRLAETAYAAQSITDEPHRVKDGFNQYRGSGLQGVGSVPTNTGQSQTTSLKSSREQSKEGNREHATAQKMSVFQQYTLKGDQIQELEYSPQKQKIDELMGRIPSGSSERNGHCYSQYKTEQKDFEMSLARESVYKTSSAGAGMMKDHQSNLSSPRDNILVSNAQSKKEIECLDFQNNSQNDY